MVILRFSKNLYKEICFNEISNHKTRKNFSLAWNKVDIKKTCFENLLSMLL